MAITKTDPVLLSCFQFHTAKLIVLTVDNKITIIARKLAVKDILQSPFHINQKYNINYNKMLL